MKSLLMATDLSARSDRALDRALLIAADRGADLTIAHVVDEDVPAPIADAQTKGAKQAIRDHIETLGDAKGVNISIAVVTGRPYATILDTSEQTNAEIIVLGMHRADAFKDMFRGTTAERVIRASNLPVLLVKERAKTAYRRILVAIDFSVCSRHAVEFAVGFIPTGQFHLVHAYDVPFKGFLYGQNTRGEVRQQQQQRFQKMIDEEMAAFLGHLETPAPTFERIMKEGSPHEVICHEVRQLEPDLLVIGTRGRTGVARAFLGSVAEELLRDPPCDILAVTP